MTPKKAILNLSEILERGSMISDPDDESSIKLGIEGLKLILANRALHLYPAYKLLPGETGE